MTKSLANEYSIKSADNALFKIYSLSLQFIMGLLVTHQLESMQVMGKHLTLFGDLEIVYY